MTQQEFFVQAEYCSMLSNHKYFPGLSPAFKYRYGILVMSSPEDIFSSVLILYPACCAQNLCCGGQMPHSLGASACFMPLCHLHLGHHSGSMWVQPNPSLLSSTPSPPPPQALVTYILFQKWCCRGFFGPLVHFFLEDLKEFLLETTAPDANCQAESWRVVSCASIYYVLHSSYILSFRLLHSLLFFIFWQECCLSRVTFITYI